MWKALILLIVFTLSFNAQAQYTETINSNRPGSSQGAFAVGRDVAEVEAGPVYGRSDHNLTGIETNIFGLNYQLRYGLLMERLEVNLRGDFIFAKQKYQIAGINQTNSISNFRTNVLGAKYLIYDPYRYQMDDKPNLYSYKANHRFNDKVLIPAISVYVGANLTFGDRPEAYPFFGQRDNISPQLALITQNNWGRFVFVMNFIADRITDDHKTYAGIFTLTHTITQDISIFAEFEAIKDDFYSDNLLRFGGAYLFTKDFQIDLSGTTNFKNTPSRWEVGVGLSYRLDMHSVDLKLNDDGSKFKDDSGDKADKEKKKAAPQDDTSE